MTWYRMDLHIHTPASADYQDLSATYLQILQKAELRGLDMIALTDHNTVGGIAAMRREIEDLELLEELSRLTPEEYNILTEYRRVLEKVLVLPGFEFTAAYGFHILAVFPPDTTIRKLDYLLLTLSVPEDQLETGSSQVGATADVLTAYETIYENGGLVIPAHVDATHGVAMQGFRFGGQTKVAYTQSPYISALEVTDLDDMTRRATASFFNGSKPEYPRRMHCIQGSDAHRISREGARRDTDLGIGDRATEGLLPEKSFAALRAMFVSDDFARTRPYQPVAATPYDPVQAAREQGPTIVQAFHEQVRSRRSRYRPLLKDVVAFANTNGGTIYVGVSANPRQPIVGVAGAEEAARGVREAVARSVVPRLDATVDVEASGGKPVLLVTVPKGPNTPYATDAGQVFVRQEGETVVALRDEIVQLVQEAARGSGPTSGTLAVSERIWNAPRPTFDADDDLEENTTEAEPDDEPTPTQPAPPVPEPQATRPAPTPITPAPTLPAFTPSETRVTVVEPPNMPEAAPQNVQAVEEPAQFDHPGQPEQPEPPVTQRAARRRPPRRRHSASATPADPDADEGTVDRPNADTGTAGASAPDTALLVYTLEPPTTASDATPDDATDTPAGETATAADDAPAPPPARRRRRSSGRGRGRQAAPADETATNDASIVTITPPPPDDGQAVTVGTSTPAISRNGTEPAALPKTGIEILAVEERDGVRYYTMRDLRSGRVVENVTRKIARRQWRQALVERENGLPAADAITWSGPLGYWRTIVRDGVRSYNLAYREGETIRYFFAVTDDGINEAWRTLIPDA